MKKAPPTKRELMRFTTVPRLNARMEFVLDFDRPVSVLKARETMRKLLDHMQIQVDGYDAPEELGEATLRSSEMKRSIHIKIRPPIE